MRLLLCLMFFILLDAMQDPFTLHFDKASDFAKASPDGQGRHSNATNVEAPTKTQEKEHQENLVLTFLENLHFDQTLSNEIGALAHQADIFQIPLGISALQEKKRRIEAIINKETTLINAINNFLYQNPTIESRITLKYIVKELIISKKFFDQDLQGLNNTLKEYEFDRRNAIKAAD